MSIAKKCDRCNKFYEEQNYKKDFTKYQGIILINTDFNNLYFNDKKMDLCPDCMEKLEEFLNLKG